MNVGFALLTLFPGRVGGTESNVRGLLEQFARGNGPEQVTVLANRHVVGPYARFARGPVSLVSVRSYRPGDRDATRLLAMIGARAAPRRAARDAPGGLDVVHYPATVPIPRAQAPTVVTLHDVQHHDLPGFPRAERLFRRWAYDRAARDATRVVTSSDFSRRRIVELLRVDPERVEVVPLGVDASGFRPGPVTRDADLLARFSPPERFVVYPANLWPHKNHRRLVEALAECADPGLHLLLTGQTYGRLAPLEGLAARLRVSARVQHLGYVSHAELAALYRAARAMIFPSLYEGFGTPPLEAMAAGCPVAASDAASLPEVCGDVALTFDPRSVNSIAEALTRVTPHSALRARLAAAGPRRAALFTWEEAARRHREIYEQAAAA